ncbi:MAG: glycyl-radical enzyme activating protein [Bacteroidota bacterium]
MTIYNYTEGIVVDVHRFSLHDGPGIRTTVFLKGCPLKCKWCHNPEAVSYNPQISFNTEKCKDCFECVKACPAGAHQINSNKHILNFALCELHGECVKVCPNEALTIIGIKKSVTDILNIVLRDKEFYKNSGGGITISGGEPMTQFGFMKSILKSAKDNSIHTCIETCGHAPTDKYLEILDLVDIFLFDYKETDSGRHKDLTGASNNLILKNLSALYEAGAEIILRCPLIPGVNDSLEHLMGIARLYISLPYLKGIEIMPYHNIGVDKAKRIGSDNNFIRLETTEAEKKEWLQKLKSLGCENVKIG